MKDIKVRQFSYDGKYYDDELTLRNNVLRKPLGLDIFNEDLGKDSEDVHVGAFDGFILVGCTLLSRINNSTLKMRQVAVDKPYQGMGIGSEMVEFCEKYAVDNGYSVIIMHARKVAVPFYTRFGYEVIGDEFTEVTVPHYKMKKVLD
jgi:GNAT superfamily N-acetyltransferase